VKISNLIRSVLFAGILSTFPAFAKAAFAGDKLPFLSGTTVPITQGDEAGGNHSGLLTSCNPNPCYGISPRWAYDMDPGVDKAIVAIREGTVIVNVTSTSGFGNYVVIRTVLGDDIYAHMKNQSTLAVGTSISQGQAIGTIGATGQVTGRHLHLERFKNWLTNQSAGSVKIQFDEDSNATNSGDSLVSQNSGQLTNLTAFYVLNNLVKYKNSTNGTTFGNEQAIPGGTTADQVSVTTFNGYYQLFLRGQDGYIYVRSLTANGWTNPLQIGDQKASTPPVVVQQGGYLNVFYATTNGQIRCYFSNNPSIWTTNYNFVEGSNTILPFSVVVQNGYFNVYYVSNDSDTTKNGKIFGQFANTPRYSNPAQVGTDKTLKGVSAILDNGYHNVFYRANDGGIRLVYTNNGQWSNPTFLSLTSQSGPFVTSYPGGMRLFVTGLGGQLVMQSLQNGSWQNPVYITGDTSNITPTAVQFNQ
jgi:Peptidase family M23